MRKLSRMNTCEKRWEGRGGVLNAFTQDHREVNQAKHCRLISLHDVPKQLPWNDILAKKGGVGGYGLQLEL